MNRDENPQDYHSSVFENLPDVRDGLNKKERAILYCLHETQKELGGRNVPTIMLYGRVLEMVDISKGEFQSILSRFVGLTKLREE
ncbi:hypothetical protein [Zhongshania arctica]|uniref:DNA topoisomerase (ATP-hydrolyzing) n=1 Tax=Zhongshania arctica TaxID=3238302 RepID=A0ABV3TZK3_9GAMM